MGMTWKTVRCDVCGKSVHEYYSLYTTPVASDIDTVCSGCWQRFLALCGVVLDALLEGGVLDGEMVSSAARALENYGPHTA